MPRSLNLNFEESIRSKFTKKAFIFCLVQTIWPNLSLQTYLIYAKRNSTCLAVDG
jgi:hypothetical protein